jgi:phosphoglycolate phosphatase-like HAD superfamily hydrolase
MHGDLIRHGQYETARQYLVRHGIPAEEIPDIQTYDGLLLQTIGGSARDTLERTVRLLYEAAPHHLANMDFDELHDLLNPIQDMLAPEDVKPYEGLSDLLYSVGKASIKFAIFTSGTPHHIVRNFGIALPELDLRDLYKDKDMADEAKLDSFVRRVEERYNIPQFTVVTSDDTHAHKPDPEPLNLAMKRLGVSRDRVLVLGDHTVDMQTAVNAGVELRVGITHGFDDRDTLMQNGATQTVDNFRELRGLFEK